MGHTLLLGLLLRVHAMLPALHHHADPLTEGAIEDAVSHVYDRTRQQRAALAGESFGQQPTIERRSHQRIAQPPGGLY
jgi:hypothetical protein